MESLKADGIKNKTIRYVNGSPIIVEVKVNSNKKKLIDPPLVYYQNVRWLRTKLPELRCNSAFLNSDRKVLILTETWLNAGILDSELGLDNFKIFRCDRNNNNSICNRVGGRC